MPIIDNYLPCNSYAGQPESENYPGFLSWFNEANSLWYFSVVTNTGRVVLRSEGYTSEAGRNNGIESVMRNRDIDERYDVVEENGEWFVILRAGNHQEIARSCPYGNETDARAGAAASKSDYSERAAANRVVDNYLPCEDYAGASAAANYPGFSTFSTGDHHYFAVVTPGGKTVLRSEGYTSEAGRNNGIESVTRNRDIEERYGVVEENGQWYVCLRAGNRQEIARSCAYGAEADARAGIAMCYSHYSDVAAKREASNAVIEDYLPCEAYANRGASNYDGFTQFMENGLHYFAMVSSSGEVILKSEGYTTASSRDNGIESVIRNRDIQERWVEAEDADGKYMSLRAGNRQEIARTCSRDAASFAGWWSMLGMSWMAKKVAEPVKVQIVEEAAPVVVPPPVVVAPKVEVPKVVPPLVVEPKKTTVYTKPVAEKVTPPPMVTYTEPVEADASGGGWWKWLLPLLLLGLLFLLWKNCCHAPEVAPVTVETPKVETPKVVEAPKPVVPPAPVCDCQNQTDVVFKAPVGTPKTLTRLGTNPEFGNSHGLTPEQFFDKLTKAAKTNAVDKTFLDRCFHAMGYANGWADAKAEQFTAVTLQRGTSGNMGYSKLHKTAYDILDPTDDKDLLAFHIKAANGCDMHFMKTCGNHFFFCGK